MAMTASPALRNHGERGPAQGGTPRPGKMRPQTSTVPFWTAQRYHPRLYAEEAMFMWAPMRLGTPLSARISLGRTVASCTSPAVTPSRCRWLAAQLQCIAYRPERVPT
jgi:hypothetical protein